MPKWCSIVLVGLVGLAAAAAVAAPPPKLEAETQPDWFAERLVTYSVDLPAGPGDGPEPSRPDTTIYLTGWQPGMEPPRLRDRRSVPAFPVPQHDTVFSRFVPATAPANRSASPSFQARMRQRTRCRQSLIRTPTPGPHWKPLTSAGIRAGVARQLLTLDDWPGNGGGCWIEH